GEAESNKRFFEELIQERVLNLKYGGQSRRNRCGDLIFVRDGNEYWYPIRDGLSTIDNETFAYVQELATKAGIGVVVESDNSPATRETTKSWTRTTFGHSACRSIFMRRPFNTFRFSGNEVIIKSFFGIFVWGRNSIRITANCCFVRMP